MRSRAERSFSFVVNLWEERREISGAEPTWRGSVVDVRDGRRHYFRSLFELCDFLAEQSTIPFAPVSARVRFLQMVRRRFPGRTADHDR
ncbi:MAG: hypothetical protein WBW04_13990 [Nitrolancea sp.]